MHTTAFEPRNRFRGTHPVRRVVLGRDRWEYWAGGQGPRGMLVLGGALTFGDSSHRLVTAFETSRRVLSPSYPGVTRAWEVVDGLARLLDLEKLDTVDVFGNGLGAGFAHLFIRRHPDRVERIALSGFGLSTPFRSAAGRALLELFERLPYGSVRQHYLRSYQRHAEVAGDPRRATELLALANELLDRHSRQSALAHLKLQTDLFRGDDDYMLSRPIAARSLLMFANDDPCYTRQEQDSLERTYPGAAVIRHLNAGRLIGLQPTQDLEKRLDVFFRPQVVVPVRVPATRVSA